MSRPVAPKATTGKPPGAQRALLWVSAAFGAGIALNADRMPAWVTLVSLGFIAWRVIADVRPVGLPRSLVRSVVAVLLVVGVLLRFRTLNGLNAGMALLALMGSIKLLETRTQRDQFIVVGAALFLLLAACLDRQNLVRVPLYLAHAWICCSALAVLAYAPSRSDSHLDDRGAVLLAGRTLLLSLPLALLLFTLFPRLPGAFWAIPRSDEALTGLGDSMTPGSIARLTSSYEVAFRAQFEGAPPPPQERYWRGPVLHDFDGATWSRTRGSQAQRDPLQYLGRQYRYRISMEPSSQRWWFALDTPTASPLPRVYFTYDYQLVSADPIAEPTQYSLVSHTSTRSTTALSALGRKQDTMLPRERNPRTRELAQQLRARADSDAQFVGAVLEHLRTGGFTYSLEPPTLGADSVDDFLFGSRTGFCGHYASAFVALMRAAGVPARVVTGYLGGEWNPVGAYFIVRQSDAHAWAEVWLQGRGWTRVDPTGVVEPARLTRGILDLLPDAVSAPARFVWSKPWLSALLQRWDALNTWWNDRVLKFSYEDQLRLLERLGIHAPGGRELGAIFAAGMLTWMSWIAWRIGRSTAVAPPDRIARAYTRLCRRLAHAGVAREAHQGPLEFATQVRTRRPDLEAVPELILRYSQLRYGRTPGTEDIAGFERAVARTVIRRSAKAKNAP